MSSTLSAVPVVAPSDAVDASRELDVFEGPEKKLEVFFGLSGSPDGFRVFTEPEWEALLTDAACTILHVQPSPHFDAYLLSESSLFVYPSRVILKTCGTTTLLLVLPKLLDFAARIGATLEHAHYSHFRYKFPSLQLFPHTSFAAEQRYLETVLPDHVAHARIIGPPSGNCWYALCTAPSGASLGAAAATAKTAAGDAEPPMKKQAIAPAAALTAARLPAEVDDLFEVAMEGLPPSVCGVFEEACAAHRGATGRALARSMTEVSGIGALLPGVTIDDWAFTPCGYSMNGHRDAFYYTVHITPEADFSYASFETNDPLYRQPSKVSALLAIFEPTTATITLTTRATSPVLPTYALTGFETSAAEHTELTPAVSVHCINIVAEGAADAAPQPSPPSPVEAESVAVRPFDSRASAAFDAAALLPCDIGSEASSDDTLSSDGLEALSSEL